jgi:Cof subfamily protein (haloacid dehalogenase superfamily)
MTKKIIFFDIDGTLLDHDKKLPSSTEQAIKLLREKGHEVAIATGRSPFMFKQLCERLDIDTYVSFNGQYVVTRNKVIYKQPLHIEALQSLTNYASTNKHPIVYMSHEDMRTNVEYHPHIEECIRTLKFDHPIFDPTYFKEREIYQSLLFCTDEEEASYIDNFGQFRFVRWHKLSTDILPVGGSKAKGIETIINQLGFSHEQVYAFGDALNDIEMLRFVKNSVAMGNAPHLVKKAAKHVTKDVSEDGIAYGLEVLGLLK